MGAYSKRAGAKRLQCTHDEPRREPIVMPSARTALPAWQKLTEHQRAQPGVHLRELFARDPVRFGKFSLTLDGMLLDYSKQRVTEETMRLLAALARECGLEDWRARMLASDRVNTTGRAALRRAARRYPPRRRAGCGAGGRDGARACGASLAECALAASAVPADTRSPTS
jgi:hypothetical protein